MSRSLSIVLALLVAGCLGAGPASTNLATTNATGPPPAQGPPLVMQLLDCESLSTVFSFPRGTGWAPPPADWPSSQFLGYDVILIIVECQRLSWGEFERPVTLAFEIHDNIYPPESCRQGQWNRFGIFHRVYIDDPEVTTWLNHTYGLPTHLTAFEGIETVENNIRSVTWAFQPEGHPASKIQAREGKHIDEPFGPITVRMAWERDGGIQFMDVAMDRHAGQPLWVTPGEMHEPTLYSHSATVYPGTGELAAFEATGKIQRFADAACTVPLDA